MGRPFIKMHGLGNDFVVIDAREQAFRPSLDQARLIADRRMGIGCDQLIVLEPSPRADVFMRIYNADGSQAEACGNATRCIASRLITETGSQDIRIETVAGLLQGRSAGDGLYTVDMGEAHFDWRDIPLAHACDTLAMPLQLGPLSNPVGVNVGNPHAVFFSADCEAVALAELGPQLEHHPLFPERANIEIVSITEPNHIRMRVWERGGGITLACGSGACAVAVAAARRQLTERTVTVSMDGGPVGICWREDNHLEMTGPVATSFSGELPVEPQGG